VQLNALDVDVVALARAAQHVIQLPPASASESARYETTMVA
jgi:hypothetical protein